MLDPIAETNTETVGTEPGKSDDLRTPEQSSRGQRVLGPQTLIISAHLAVAPTGRLSAVLLQHLLHFFIWPPLAHTSCVVHGTLSRGDIVKPTGTALSGAAGFFTSSSLGVSLLRADNVSYLGPGHEPGT